MSETNLCRYCGNVHEIQTVQFQGGTIETCPMVPRDRFVAIFPRSEPEPLQVKYDGDPPTATVKMGQYLSATEWAMQWAGTKLPSTSLATVSNRDGKTYLNGQLMEEGKIYNAGGVFDTGRSSFDWDAAMQRTLDEVNKHDNTTTRRGRCPLTPSEFPNIPGVPKPDHALVEIDGDFYYRAADGREVQITDGAWVSNGKSNAQINYEMRENGLANKAAGILKHGPYGSGESGPCDADCAKCARDAQPAIDAMVRKDLDSLVDESFAQEQRGEKPLCVLAPFQREEASARWSAQLRVRIAEQKERDAEAARYTPWWSPEEQQGGDL